MATKKDEMLAAELPATAAPPPYKLSRDGMDDSTDSDSDTEYVNAVPSTGGLTLPGVIPQNSTAFRGPFFSPFIRAYVPELEAHGIDRNDFVAYIDGLNEAFVNHPAFQGVGMVGGVMTMAYGVHPVQMAGMGLQWGAGLAGAATSYARTRAYVKATNKDLFHPAGLHVNVLTTKKMLKKVGFPEEKMQLPPVDIGDNKILRPGMKPKEAAEYAAKRASDDNDPRMRRLEALKGYVLPYDLDVPAQSMPDNFLRKMGAQHAAKLEKKQSNKATKRQAKYYKGQAKMERIESRQETRQSRHDEDLAWLDDDLEKQLSLTDDPKARQKLEREHEKEKSKLIRKHEKRNAKSERKLAKRAEKHDKRTEKVDEKEEKIANKIRWLVISKWQPDVDSDQGSVGSSEDEDVKQ